MISKEINIKIYENITKNIIQDYDPLNEEEVIIDGEDSYIFVLTTLENAKNNTPNNISKIDIGECEDLLRESNNITNSNISLLILLYEKQTNISSKRDVQFEVYESETKSKLDLAVCNNVSIDIYVPLVLSEELYNLYNELKEQGYDLFNINSDFYQDICTPFSSSNGTDVLLSDRANYYFNNDETQCQSGCSFLNYNFETQSLKCECNINETQLDIENIKKEESSKSLYKSFYDVLKYSNYKVLKCYKLAFQIKNLYKNIGTILALIYFIIYLIFLIIYCIKGITPLINEISKLVRDNNAKETNDKSPIVICENAAINSQLISNNISDKDNNKETLNKKESSKIRKSRRKKRKSKTMKNNPSYPPIKKRKSSNLVISKNAIILTNHKESGSSLNKLVNEIKNEKGNGDIVKIMNTLRLPQGPILTPIINEEKPDNFELNNMEYQAALETDKRSFINIYWSILEREHLIIFTFFTRNDHNLIYIKFTRFIFLVCTDMALNVFFFADETMHKMFLDYGKYNFVQQIPQIIYSTIVSQLIELLLCFLSLTDKHYYQVKESNLKNANDLIEIVKCIKIKINLFYIFIFIVFIFNIYIVTCFCAVYINTQSAFIKDSVSSFALGLLYPFILYLFPALLRLISLKYCKGKLSAVYKVSEIIPFF